MFAVRLLQIILIISFSVNASGLFPVPLDKHIKDADVILDGVFESEFKLGKSGENYEASFKLIRSIGLSQQELQNNYLIKIKYSQAEDESGEFVDFQKKERVVLFLKRDKGDLKLLNNALSKYSVVRRGREWIMVSEVFPFHPVVGQVRVTDFVKLAEKQKLVSFHKSSSIDPKYFASRKKFGNKLLEAASLSGRGRNIASGPYVFGRKPASTSNQISILWLMVILGSLSALSKFISNKNSE
jgi:hypothetical protein